MTNFTINAENVKRLQTLSGQSKDLISLTKPIFCPSDGNLSVNLYSSRVTMSFSIDISNFVTTDQGELNYFSMSIDEFNTTLSTVSNGENDVLVEVDKDNNKVTFKNDKNIPNDAVETWDMSEAGDNSIIGYIVKDSKDGYSLSKK